MNTVVLMGRLTRDPELRTINAASGPMQVARYTLAVDRYRKSQNGEQTADFISCIAFGRQADFADHYLRNGIKICIQGRIQTGSYTNREGQKIYTTDVVVNNQEFAESRAAQHRDDMDAPADNGGYVPANNTDVEDEGLPFA